MTHDLYYEQGFFKTEVSEELKKLLWNEIYSTEWCTDTVDKIYKKIPSWYKSKHTYKLNNDGSNRSEFERAIGADILKNTPSSLIDIGRELVNISDFDFFKKYYKKVELQYVDLWNGSEEIPYHFDTINGSDTLVLIYLTEQQHWDINWGGSISLKKECFNKTVYENTFLPCNGTMLIINNANPLVLHQVSALKNKSVNRYTFSFIYKWF